MESKYQCKNIIASGHTTVNLSRMCLLKWVNDLLGTKIEKVEALCSGAAYCQILNMLFPGCIPLKKVKFEAKLTHEFWSNFKQLQMGFRAIGCEKAIQIHKLVKGKFVDSFEFLQWFKRFYDMNYQESTCSSITSKPVTDPQTSSKARSRNIYTRKPKYSAAGEEMKMKSELAEWEFYLNELGDIEIKCTSEEATSTDNDVLVNKRVAELHATPEGFDSPEEPQEE